MASKSTRVGIIGTGGIARHQHIPSYRNSPGYEIVAACDVNPDSVKAVTKDFCIPEAYSDYREMLGHAKLDLVSICTSNDMHYAIAMAAIDKGLDVYCEKPLALTVAQAREMTEAARAKGICTGVNFSHRRTPAARLAKEILDTGALGDIYYVSAVYAVGGTDYPKKTGSWRNQIEKAGYGGLGDMGAHIIDMMRWWLQAEVTDVTGQLTIFVPKRNSVYDGKPMQVTSEDQGMILVKWSNGAQGYFCGSYSFTGRGYDQRVEIYGSDGGLMYDQHRPHELDVFLTPEFLAPYTVLRPGGTSVAPYTTILVPERLQGLSKPGSTYRQSVLMDFLEAYSAGKPFQPSFEEGLAAQQILEGARVGHEERRWVHLPI
jgi:predicted dehydrogenase